MGLAGFRPGARRREAPVLRRVGWRARLYAAALFRLLGLLGHGRRPVAAIWRAASLQFRLALQGAQHHRVLAPLAHDAFALPARLPLFSAWRQSQGPGAALRESDGDDVAGRPVARRKLDIRGLGRTARPLPGRQPRMAAVGAAPRMEPHGSEPLSIGAL